VSYASAAVANFVNIFTSPKEAFRDLKSRPSIWLPLLLLIGAWIVLWNWYYHTVDFPWLVNHLVDVRTHSAPVDEQQAIAAGIVKMKPGAFIVITVFSVIIVFLALTLFMSLYFLILGAIYDDPYRFRHWFAFTLWATMPSLVAVVAIVANVLLTDGGRVAPEQANPLSLNNLFFHVGLDNKFKQLLDSLDLTVLWSWVLMVVGYREWTQRSWSKSLQLVLAPLLVIYSIWIAVLAF
jgi:Yip1 domain